MIRNPHYSPSPLAVVPSHRHTRTRSPAIANPERAPDERPQRRREYSGAASTLGVAALLVLIVGVGIWWFELRGDDGPGSAGGPLGIVALPDALNPTGRAAAADPGRAAPNFKLASVDGSSTPALVDYRGRWVLINFWASWCGPCRQETPDLQRLHEAQGPSGLVILGVNQQERRETADAFVSEFNVTYPILLDSDGAVNSAYRVGRGMPISVLVDASGIVRRVFFGRIDEDMLASIGECAAGRAADACAGGAG